MSTHIALKPFTARGKTYKAGDVIDPTGWPHRRVELLESTRHVRRVGSATRRHVALRTFSIGEKTLQPGDELPSTLVSGTKLEQLVGLRYVRIDDNPIPASR